MEKLRALEPFKVSPGRSDVAELARIIDEAEDERPIQEHLGSNPQFLSAVLGGGHGKWVRPQVELGSQYVADFLIADADSSGVNWVLVELESPRKPITMQSGELADRARHGLDQIQSWRHWLQENLDYARKHPRDAGLGLIDVEPTARGLLLIGRRTDLLDAGTVRRRQVAAQQQVAIHTYDWLVEINASGWIPGGAVDSRPNKPMNLHGE